jgi:hypothetical protein
MLNRFRIKNRKRCKPKNEYNKRENKYMARPRRSFPPDFLGLREFMCYVTLDIDKNVMQTFKGL